MTFQTRKMKLEKDSDLQNDNAFLSQLPREDSLNQRKTGKKLYTETKNGIKPILSIGVKGSKFGGSLKDSSTPAGSAEKMRGSQTILDQFYKP